MISIKDIVTLFESKARFRIMVVLWLITLMLLLVDIPLRWLPFTVLSIWGMVEIGFGLTDRNSVVKEVKAAIASGHIHAPPAMFGMNRGARSSIVDGENISVPSDDRFRHLTATQKALLAFYFMKGNRYALHWLFPNHDDVEVLERLGHIERQNGKGNSMSGYAYVISDNTYNYFQKHFSELENQDVVDGFESLGKEPYPPFGFPYP